MLRKKFLLIALTFMVAAVSAQYRTKMLVKQSPGYGQYKLKILRMAYDSTVSDSSIINCIDTLPSLLFGARTYNMLYKDDSTRLAIMANEHGMFRKKFFITLYWKNGNMKRLAVYKRHSRSYLCSTFYSNEILASRGKYRNNKKVGRWIYTNSGKKKTRVEHYASDGTLKKAKDFKPPHGTFATFFTAAKPDGSPYVIMFKKK
jgi:hypothetical protein